MNLPGYKIYRYPVKNPPGFQEARESDIFFVNDQR